MPVGIITNVTVTFLGGIAGAFLGKKLSERYKIMLNNILGIAAIVMGIFLIMKVKNLSAAVLSLILGAVLGEMVQLEKWINQGALKVASRLVNNKAVNEEYLMKISSALVLFCCGGTGWYGAFNEGLTGDGSILITKGILDFITACIFAAILGKVVLTLCVPQIGVYFILYCVSSFVASYVTPDMISDFSAVGGMVTLVAGLRLAGIKTDIKTLNLLPALVLSFFISALWSSIF